MTDASSNLLGTLWVKQIYDFIGSTGIGFYWKGADVADGDQIVEFMMWSPTGGWVGKFPDGEDEWRWVFLEWVEDLVEVGFDIERPDKSQVTQILWTYYSSGIRGLDGIQIWYSNDVKGVFTVRHPYNIDLLASFDVQHSASSELSAKLEIKNAGSADLTAEVVIRQTHKDLLAKFYLRQEVSELFAHFHIH